MIELLTSELAGISGWRGWWFWHVTAIGGHSPADVSRWSMPQVIDAACDLMVKGVLEAM